MKMGSPHRLMQKLFGWNDSCLQEWHEKVLLLMKKHMNIFHRGFLDFMGPVWQEEEITVWKVKHLLTTRDYASFVERIDNINADAVAKGLSVSAT